MNDPVTGTSLNPYAPPAAAPIAQPLDALNILPEEFDAFVGPKGPYYHRRWAIFTRTGGRSLVAGFNLVAFFLNSFWFLYRKMYRDFFLYSLVPSIAIYMVLRLTAFDPNLQKFLPHALRFTLMSVCGFIGNGLYFRRARAVILQTRRDEPDLANRLTILRRRGGTTLLWPAVLLIATAVVFAIGRSRK